MITPSAIRYDYRLMFEDRSIELMTYTAETLLAEKIQTILVRGITTTRMRDFYDVYEIVNGDKIELDGKVLEEAFVATCIKRQTIFNSFQIKETLKLVTEDKVLPKLWELYRKDNFYVGNMEWQRVCENVCAYILEKLEKGVELNG